MSTNNKAQRVADNALATTTKETPTLLDVLPLVLSFESSINQSIRSVLEEDDLFLDDEPVTSFTSFVNKIRLTCKDAKLAADPYLSTVSLDPLVGNNFLLRSSLVAAAKALKCMYYRLSKEFISEVIQIPFHNLQEVSLSIKSDALDLVPKLQSPALTSLDLKIEWAYKQVPRLRFTSFWRARTSWPLLESISLSIEPRAFPNRNRPVTYEYNGSEDDYYSEEDGDRRPKPDYGGAICLLSYFPNLKKLQFGSTITTKDLKKLVAAKEIKNLESLDLAFDTDDCTFAVPAKILAGAVVPKLQELKLHATDHICTEEALEIVSIPWIKQLQRLTFPQDCLMCLNATKVLIQGLQFGDIEYLKIVGCSVAVFQSFENVNLPNLKTLVLQDLEDAAQSENPDDALDIGLSSFFSTANLPKLETLIVFFNCTEHEQHWTTLPGCAKLFETQPFSVLPSLKRIYFENSYDYIDVSISKECSSFLYGFYKRGCQIKLDDIKLDSGMDLHIVGRLLGEFLLPIHEMDMELRELGLFEKFYWFNLLTMEEIRTVAALTYLRVYKAKIEDLKAPLKAVAKATNVAYTDLLQKRLKEASEATQALDGLLTKMGKDGASGSGGGGASGSGQ